MEASRRQFISGLTAAAAVPLVAALPIPKDRGPWIRYRNWKACEQVWNGDVMVDGRNGRVVGIFWEGKTYKDMPFCKDNRVTGTYEEEEAWTSLDHYRKTLNLA
jgi:hypothetical protein